MILQFSNQIKEKFPAKSCGAWAIFLTALGTRLPNKIQNEIENLYESLFKKGDSKAPSKFNRFLDKVQFPKLNISETNEYDNDLPVKEVYVIFLNEYAK